MNSIGRDLAALVLLVVPSIAPADEKVQLPLQLKIVANKDTYKSDLTLAELKKLVEAAEKGGRLPPAPAVDLQLVITNRSEKEVAFWFQGDPVQIALELKGPGAMSLAPRLNFSANFIGPQTMKLAPGKSHTIQLTSLRYGFRGASRRAYWTDPGEYTLAACFKTAISPSPQGLRADETGFVKVALKSEPVKIKVEKK